MDDHVRLSDQPIESREAEAFVGDPACGAIATFVGVTRDTFEDKTVAKLSYEAYGPMALKEMRRLCELARERWDVKKCAILHRTGEVPIGGASVVIAVSAPHRKDALEACAWLIDELKATVPIWKKESYVDGDAPPQWKQNDRDWAPPPRRTTTNHTR
ncbi:hypothetical protein CTAYLR_006706 [Chrysophaeum taylorii]|uniref:Molybdopterin synthase catalytic subunit n=1 Tax=Chrysophaeum taylorii TaxID=2483200 RepID=A0AAD7UD28_9STRA|nr:hypothetical protein CTAYLR_006706 [Chrysophaeum taylorii]